MSLYVFLHFKNENNGNARDFCVLILYPVTWLYCIDWLALVISEGIFRLFYVKDHVICNEGFTSPFPIWIPFISISPLIAVAKTAKTMLNSSGESVHPCLVPDIRGNAFNFLPLRIMFAVGLSYMDFIMLRYVPSIPAFWRVFFFFNHKWMLILSKAFSASIEIIIWFLSFNLLMWCITLIDLWILKNPYIPDKAHLVMMYDLFNMLLDSVY